jgi:hypothetical protein
LRHHFNNAFTLLHIPPSICRKSIATSGSKGLINLTKSLTSYTASITIVAAGTAIIFRATVGYPCLTGVTSWTGVVG